MLYRFAWIACRFFLVLIRRMEIRGIENLPPCGFVLVSNHRSYWDPVIVGCSLPKERHVYFMAKAELFIIPLLGPIIKIFGAFPVKRGKGDRSAIRTALKLLNDNKIVGIFPEGKRSKSEEMLNPHLGAAMLATKASVPVLPVAVKGSIGFFGKVKVFIGPAMYFNLDSNDQSTKADRDELTRTSFKIMDSLSGLINQ